MRIAGVLLIILGLLMSLSIVGAIVGVPLMLIGFVMVIVGRRKTIITNVVNVSNTTERAGAIPLANETSPGIEARPLPRELPRV